MPNQNQPPRPSRNRPDLFSLLNSLWQHSIIVARQRWGLHQPEYPGHDPGDLATIEFAVLPVGNRVLVLSNQDCDDSGYENTPEDERPSRVRIIGKTVRKWRSVRERIDLYCYEGWEWTWFFTELPEGDGSNVLLQAVAQAKADEEHLLRCVYSLRHQLRQVESLVQAANRTERD